MNVLEQPGDWLSSTPDEKPSKPLTESDQYVGEDNAITLADGDSVASQGVEVTPETKDNIRQQAEMKHKQKWQAHAAEAIIASDSSPHDKAVALKEVPSTHHTSTQEAVYAITGIPQSKYLETVSSTIRSERKAASMLAQIRGDVDAHTSGLGMAADFLGLLAPGNYGTSAAQLNKALTGKEGAARYAVNSAFVGEAMKSTADYWATLSADERVARIEDIKQWAEDNSAIIGENSVVIDSMIAGLEQGITPGMRAFENVMGVFDIAPLAGAAKGVVGAALKGGKSLATAKMLAKRLDDMPVRVKDITGKHEEAAKEAAPHMTEEDIPGILAHAPLKVAIEEAGAISPALKRELERIGTTAEAVAKGAKTNALSLTDKEKSIKIDKLRDELSSTKKLRIVNSTYDDTKTGFNANVLFGNTKGGFQTWAEARGAMKQLGSRAAKAEVVVRDVTTGEERAVGDLESLTTPEYFVRYQDTHEFDLVGDHLAGASGGREGFFGTSSWMRGTSQVTRYLVDDGNKLSKQIMDMVNVSDDSKGFIRDNLREHMKPLTKLGHISKGRVLKILDDGSREMKHFSIPDLIAHTPNITEGEIAGYYAARTTADLLFEEKNAIFRKKLISEGMQTFTDKGHKAAGTEPIMLVGKAVREKPTVDVVKGGQWDVMKRELANVDQAYLDQVYANGGYVVRLHSPKVMGRAKVDYAIIRAGDKAASELPKYVLKYRPGHIHKYYKARWFVPVEKTLMRAGVPETHTEVIAAYDNYEDALAHSYSGVGKLLEPQVDRSLGLNSSGEDVMAHLGGTLFHERGNGLEGQLNGQARTEDIITSLTRDIDAVAHLSATGDVTEVLSKEFKTHYGEFLNPDGSFNTTIHSTEAIEAKEAFDILQHYRRIPSSAMLKSRASMVGLARWLGSKSTLASNLVHDAATIDVGQALRTASYGLFIAMNPGKQLILQGTQFMMLAGINPLLAAKSLTQSFAFHTAYLARGTKYQSRAEHVGAIAAGVDKEEFRNMADALHSTGMIQSLANHTVLQATEVFAGNAAYKTGAARLGQVLGNAVKVPFNVAQKAGFQAGEAHNITVTWLMAHNRWKEANPGKKWAGDKDLYAEWGAKARQWQFNPNTTGAFKWQRGILAVPTQFLGFQIKAWNAVLRNGHAFTKSERARMVMGLVAAYGTSGVIGAEAWDKFEKATGTHTTPIVREWVDHGMVDMVANTLLTEMYGRDEKGRKSAVAISETLNPLTGVEMLYDMAEGDTTLGKLLAGVSYYAAANVYKQMKFAHDIWQDPLVKDADKGMMMVNALLEIAPFMSNEALGMAMNQTHSIINKSDMSILDKATTGEALAMGIFGLRSRKEMEVWDKRVANSYSKKELRNQGKEMAHVANLLLSKEYAKSGLISGDSMIKIMHNVRSLSAGYGLEAKREIMKGFTQSLNIQDKTEGLTKLYTMSAGLGKNLDSALIAVDGSPLLNEEDKKQAREIIKAGFDDSMLADIVEAGQ